MRTRKTRRALVTLVAAMAMVFATVGGAFAQSYPPDAFIECSDMTPGETAVCVASGLVPGESHNVIATLYRTESGTASAAVTLATSLAVHQFAPSEVLLDDSFTADADGEIQFAFDIPADAEDGDLVEIEIVGVGFAVFEVTEDDGDPVAPVTPRPAVTQLPRTGLEVSVLIAIALAALVVGGGALVAARRRGSATA